MGNVHHVSFFLFFYSLIFLSHFLVFVLSLFSFSPFEPISNFYYSIQILVWSHYFNFKMHNQNFSMNTTIVILFIYIYIHLVYKKLHIYIYHE
jgi:hypothetical protein